ncbi:MAG: hypothetical protein KGJ37_03560, partial [Verrucomicrobiota bacterium]|nr:hypothetical protein [Verrucomicrobiota bacterium]
TIMANFESTGRNESLAIGGTDVSGDVFSRPTAEPLTQVAPPGEIRRARILAALADTRSGHIEPVAFTRTRERIASRLADENLEDDISRLGVGGDRVSFKF